MFAPLLLRHKILLEEDVSSMHPDEGKATSGQEELMSAQGQ